MAEKQTMTSTSVSFNHTIDEDLTEQSVSLHPTIRADTLAQEVLSLCPHDGLAAHAGVFPWQLWQIVL
jgi:hypothetical protein